MILQRRQSNISTNAVITAINTYKVRYGVSHYTFVYTGARQEGNYKSLKHRKSSGTGINRNAGNGANKVQGLNKIYISLTGK